ncbi:MAG: hypothetical protein Q8Q56_04975 [Alphaproteobacteria bacterium]|nr:hypothetical protein [Alphaproteobacteria bacterium]
MDEKYLHSLRQGIVIALKKAESSLLNDQPIDLDVVKDRVQLFQNYLTKHMPENPSDDLKTLVYDVFLDIQHLSDQIAEEAKLSKSRISELANSQKIAHTYTYGVRK